MEISFEEWKEAIEKVIQVPPQFISKVELCEKLKISNKGGGTVRKIKKLVESGWLERITIKGKNYYKLVIPK